MDLRGFWITLLAFCCSGCLATAPSVPVPIAEYAGILVGETRWAGEVILAEDVIIPRGSALEIAPGTRVIVRPSVSTKIEPEQLSSQTELLIRGRLNIRGTEKAPVLFVIESEAEGDVAWAGIIAERAESLQIAHATIPQAEQGVWVIASPGSIRGSEFIDGRYGLVFQHPGEFEVRDSIIRGGEAGIFCWRGASPQLNGNIVSDHAEEGVYIDAVSLPRFENNTVRGNTIGLVTSDLSLADGNLIDGNGTDLMTLGGQR